MSIPSCEQFSTAAERIARTLAVAVAVAILAAQLTYEAGYALGRILHKCNDWLARASHAPVTEAAKAAEAAIVWADRVTAPAAPTTFAQVLAAEGIKPLTPAELDAEIEAWDAKQAKPAARRRKATPRPTVRRKSAGATRVKVAA
jgi:hypothetical protein